MLADARWTPEKWTLLVAIIDISGRKKKWTLDNCWYHASSHPPSVHLASKNVTTCEVLTDARKQDARPFSRLVTEGRSNLLGKVRKATVPSDKRLKFSRDRPFQDGKIYHLEFLDFLSYVIMHMSVALHTSKRKGSQNDFSKLIRE